LLGIHSLSLLTRDLEKLGVEFANIIVEEVTISGIGLFEISKENTQELDSTHSALVGTLWVIESVDIESFLWNFALDITLINNVLPKLLWALCSWETACHTNNRGIFRHMGNLFLGRDGGCVSGGITRLEVGIRESIDGNSRIASWKPIEGREPT
jgi:hypothetical protein